MFKTKLSYLRLVIESEPCKTSVKRSMSIGHEYYIRSLEKLTLMTGTVYIYAYFSKQNKPLNFNAMRYCTPYIKLP